MQDASNQKLTLDNAKQFIPTSFGLIRELVNFLDELEKDQYLLARQPVDEILSIMNTLNLPAIREDLAFTKMQGKLFKDTEEERLLFAKDPYVYFYEDFLKSYDPAMKKRRGVYYTPPPIVNFIICSINGILKDTFGISKGLADHRKVTVLDFATGTGTFLIEILQQIFENVSEGIQDQVIQEHVLKNLYGFECLIAPYTIAHLKLSQFLRDKGYEMKRKERLQIYLTNTLEPILPQANWLLPALSKEVEQAQEVKDKPILVITGNPPYSGKSKNTGKWITALLKGLDLSDPLHPKETENYYYVDGKPLGEKNPKWLQDDYVKFIRFAQWKMQQVDEGIVGIITNHSYLDNPTFRGMRQSLMRTFNQIYVLDLHGNSKKKEKSPDGSKDENVFDIEQGVAITLLVKKKGLANKIYHTDIFGQRRPKYRRLLEESITTSYWQELKPNTPFYLFIPQDEMPRAEYERGWKVTDIFPVKSVGVVTADDGTLIAFTEQELKLQIGEKFGSFENDKPQLINYRPFDTRYIYYDTKRIERAREGVMRHMLHGDENTALVTSRMTKGETFKHVQATDKIVEVICMSPKTSNNAFVFPLYIYRSDISKIHMTAMFPGADSFEGKERRENLSPAFRTFIDNKYSKHYEPEQILGYVYAILHSPTYRSNYTEFLKMDFPRIPFVDDAKIFEELSALGWQLVQRHLLKKILTAPNVDINKGSSIADKPLYDEKQQRLYINKDQYFSPVPKDVWEFHTGGYQVLDKYLKFRKGRKLTLDEIENVQNVVKVLAFTITQMQKIDEVWKP